MKIPGGWFLLHQPKVKVPSVFDLNPKGVFREKPFVTQSQGARVLINEAPDIRLQYLNLTEKRVIEEGISYSWVCESGMIALEADLSLDSKALDELGDARLCEAIHQVHQDWYQAYVPTDSDGRTDSEALKQKLENSLADLMQQRRQALAEQNKDWVLPALPRKIFDFTYGLNLWLGNRLYQEYQAQGGEESHEEMIKKINLFDRVFELEDPEALLRPDGGRWESPRDIWDCWVGFIGSEAEARRVFSAMERIFPPAQEELG